MKIPAASPWFEGHFDGAPILPGIAHIALALGSTNRVLKGVRDVRFRKPIGPGAEVDVVLTVEKDSTRFEIRQGDEVASSGVLVFEP